MSDRATNLDRVIHQPVRTRLMAHLIGAGDCDYTSLKNALGLSDGHMSTHMKELISSGYVAMEKEFVNNKPRTTYGVTRAGRKAFARYIDALKTVIAAGS